MYICAVARLLWYGCLDVLFYFNLSSGNNHSFVRGHFIPLSTVIPLYSIVYSFSKKVTLHPASHNLTTDSNDWCFSCGIMCASVAH